MMKQLLSPALLLLIFFLLCATTSGQSSAPATAPSGPTTVSGQSSPPAPATSGPSGPPDIISVLQKASKFTTFIGLLKSSQVDVLINTQLKKSNQGFTVFAPTDSAFSDLKTGTLNSFTDQQKAALTKFHVIPSFLTISQFQTVSNPIHTQAGENTVEFPLNVIGNGTHVNMTTGLVNTTVDSTVYSDGQLAVYEIPQVLLSQGILSPQAPAPAPLAPKPKKAAPLNALAPTRSTTVSVDSSDATCLPHYAPTVVSIGVAVLAAMSLSL
ncbi:fasciclin-like arabinogalactan protein 11 [Vitis riparia]|uniref:fasciclin-like arabinogalactan protein 11 n=1 Tax=Vitis riparia TaxID=96939 RepID=UPI00155A6AB4|nr:fasciclin-like arabinogalactan protein 11 [Vitis riparia]